MSILSLLAEPCPDHRPTMAPSDTAILQMFGQAQGTFRRQQFGVAPAWSWRDCLARCSEMVASLDRSQLVALLDRASDRAFRQAVLARYDEVRAPACSVVYLWERTPAADRADFDAGQVL